MSQMSDYLENALINHLFNKTSYTIPTVYVALCTSAPTDADTGTTIASKEPSGSGYARKSTVAGDWNSASGGSITNANTITFATPTGSWGTLTHFALIDASSAGNVLMYGSLTTSQAAGLNNTVSFSAGQLSATFQ